MENSNLSENILLYLKDSKKPVVFNQICSELKKFSKIEINKCLKKQIKEELILEKTFGKTKIYFYKFSKNSDTNPDNIDEQISSLKKDLKYYEDTIKEKTELLKKLKEKNSAKEEIKKNEINNKMNDEALNGKENCKKNEVIITEPKNKKRAISNKGNDSNSKTKRFKKTNELDTISDELKKRKRIVKEIVDSIFENYNKPKKNLLEEIGLEFYE